MGSFQVRTDLALEAREYVDKIEGGVRGVRVEETYDEEQEIRVTRVWIESRNGAKAMGKPMGMYLTLEAPAMAEPEEDYHQEISSALGELLREVIPEPDREQSILVVGLGNREVTADALGPHVADHLFVNRHVVREYGKAAYNKTRMHTISCLVPGVMAQTGMETAEIVKGVVEQTAPDLVIVVDALAARSVRRLNRTIQITDTGIHPGSGVANHRNGLTRESLSVPVIAIGVPTVVDAATIVHEAATGGMLHGLTELNNMYVTTKDVDYQIRQLGHIICDGIHRALEL